MPIKEASWEEVSEDERTEITVSDSSLKKIVAKMGYNIENGFITDSEGTPIKSNDEREIKMGSLGGIGTGSKIFIRDNLASFSDYLAKKKSEKR